MTTPVGRFWIVLLLVLGGSGCVLTGDDATDPVLRPPSTPLPAPTQQSTPSPLASDDPGVRETDDDPGDQAVVDPPPPGSAMFGEVDRVVDGDTVVVELDGERERVRLLRIDTPELARDGDPAECLANEATAALERLLPEGEPVLLATDVEERDQFGRLLAHVWTRATWVNAQMLRDGYAQVVTFPPNTAFDNEVLAAQQRARDAGLGLWDPALCP